MFPKLRSPPRLHTYPPARRAHPRGPGRHPKSTPRARSSARPAPPLRPAPSSKPKTQYFHPMLGVPWIAVGHNMALDLAPEFIQLQDEPGEHGSTLQSASRTSEPSPPSAGSPCISRSCDPSARSSSATTWSAANPSATSSPAAAPTSSSFASPSPMYASRNCSTTISSNPLTGSDNGITRPVFTNTVASVG